MSGRYITNVVDTYDAAARDVETFKARGVRRERRVQCDWPIEMRHIGQCLAVEYTSDKWKQIGDYEDYKHLAESVEEGAAPTEFLACDDMLTAFGKPRTPLEVFGRYVAFVQPMPLVFAELAELLGVQLRLYVGEGRGGPHFGSADEGVMQVRFARCLLGGARHPVTKRPFLMLYSPNKRDGIHAVITGSALDIEKDGLVG